MIGRDAVVSSPVAGPRRSDWDRVLGEAFVLYSLSACFCCGRRWPRDRMHPEAILVLGYSNTLVTRYEDRLDSFFYMQTVLVDEC